MSRIILYRESYMYSQRIAFFLILLMFLSGGVVAGADQPTTKNFSNGIQAFDEGDYEKALEFFQKAQQADLNSSALHYNFGVTYYKLKRYVEARREFEGLSKESETAALAHYNLGLIGLAVGDKTEAGKHFRFALRKTKDPKLRRIAGDRLGEMSMAERAGAWAGYVSLAAGYDDNVYFIADGDYATSNVNDNFLEFIGSAAGQVTGSREHGLQLKGSVYYQDYLKANEFDFGDVRMGPELDLKLGQWNTSLAGIIGLSSIDKELFERNFIAEVRGSREIHQNIDLHLKYQLAVIDAEAPFENLSGSRHRMTAGLRKALWKTNTGLDYTLELNDRDDPDFPTRHTVSLLAHRNLFGSWNAGVNLDYRSSDYQRTNRSDKRIQFGLRASRSVPWGFRAFGKFNHLRNDSILPENEYTRNVFSIGVERFF